MIWEAFDKDSPPRMGPEDFYGKKKFLCEKCIVTFSRKIAEFVIKSFPCKKARKIQCANGGGQVYVFTHQGETIAFYMSRIGSALAGTDVIDANYLTGATKFVMFGSAGSLNSEKTTGKYLIPTEAYRGEGLSYYYAAPSDYLEIKNASRMREIFTELSLPIVSGRVFTTDAFYRETEGILAKRREEGCLAVEMELAGVQAVCDFHGFSLYDFLVTGDVLDSPTYDIGTLKKVNHDTANFLTALAVAERI